MNNIEVLDFKDFYILVSKVNGNVLTLSSDEYNNREYRNEQIVLHEMYKEMKPIGDYNMNLFKTVYISLHTSAKCNLSCTYCFKKERDYRDLTFEESKKFIDMIISEFPNAGKFIVDPTGSGEPLLETHLLVEIADYCKIKSNVIKKEVLPMLVTNGTLLTNKKVEILQNSGYIFGVSIDGDRKTNDAYRKDSSGNGVYKKVINNVKNIKHKQYIGAAVTLTDRNTDLVKTIKHLIKYFPTISIKPVRSKKGEGGLNEENIEDIKESYTKFFDFISKETLQGNLEYIGSLLNGDDYFGKFVLRAILSKKVLTRCDAGLGRFSLSNSGKIYVCPGGVDVDELVVGTLDKGLDRKKIESFWNKMTERKQCGNCFARFVCGGECMINAYYANQELGTIDSVMCILKKHLYKLALLYNYVISRSKYIEVIYSSCIEKVCRFNEDLEITDTLNHTKDLYTFTQLKSIKDDYPSLFKEIVNQKDK